ncbi:MAG: GDP-mannose 4,6-dehydratase [Deltaproteobacteria bacterium]|nr:GDP-mannose 4,6-dehydratase [Candidatus Zymogenaceae bacterium]
MATIAITGGAGFIGSHLADRLLESGERVVNIDNFNDYYNPAVKRRNIAAAQETPLYTLCEGDIRDRGFVGEVLDAHRPDLVIHLAAMAGVRPSLENPLLYQEVNIIGTNNLLEEMNARNIKKLLCASSSSVYGNCPRIPFSESDPDIHPISPYGVTKLSGEHLCYAYHRLFQMDILCFRFFTVYGPRQRPDMAIHKFTDLIDSGQPIRVFHEGKSSRDYTYIDDIIQGVLGGVEFVMSASAPVFEIFNLGEATRVPLIEMIGHIEAGLNKTANTIMMPAQPGDVQTTYADIEKARRLLGYRPTTPIETGIDRFLAWYRTERRA